MFYSYVENNVEEYITYGTTEATFKTQFFFSLWETSDIYYIN